MSRSRSCIVNTRKVTWFLAATIVVLGSIGLGPIQGVRAANQCVKPDDPINCFTSIQAAIDAASPGDLINVYPGTYDETAVNRYLVNGNGPYSYGLFVNANQHNLTIQGVDASGIPITDYNYTQANVRLHSATGMGVGAYIEGDHTTISGLKLWSLPNPDQNQTILVTGDTFNLIHSYITMDPSEHWGSVYIDDEQFDAVNNVSHIQSYTIAGNYLFDTSIDPNNGAGFTGPVNGRVILDNVIDANNQTFATISFTGSGVLGSWFKYGVGGAVITGNTFHNGNLYIRARADYDNSQFNWASYWNNNTFDRAVVVGPNPPADLREYTFTRNGFTYQHARQIGATIQGEVDIAANGDTVLAKAGSYPEQVLIDKNLTLSGPGATTTRIRPPEILTSLTGSSAKSLVTVNNGAAVTMTGFTVAGPMAAQGCGDLITGIYVYQGGSLNLSSSVVSDIRAVNSGLWGCQIGIGIRVGEYGVYNLNGTGGTPGHGALQNVSVSGYQKGGIVFNGAGTTGSVNDSTVTGVGNSPNIAQNGLQVSRGAAATLHHNTVSGNRCDHPTACGSNIDQDQATGIMLYHPGTGTVVTGNISSNNDIGFYNTNAIGSTPATVEANYLTSNRYEGIFLEQGNLALTNNEISGSSNMGVVVATGLGGADTVTTNITLTNNIISGGGTGLRIADGYTSDGFYPQVIVDMNSLVGNTTGLNSTISALVSAEQNWWGSQTGPAAGEVIGNVDSTPWLCDGTDAQPGAAGFQPLSTGQCTNVATRLVFSTQPGNGIAGGPLSPQPVVQAQDDSGALAVNFNGWVVVSIGNNPGGGVLTGTTTIRAVGGVATYSGLAINKPGIGYDLVASASGLAFDVSHFFDVMATDDQADMELTLAPVASVNTSAQFSYTIHVTNHGPLVSNAITVTDLLPDHVTFVSASGAGWICSNSGNVVTCYRASLAAGSAPEITITVNAPATIGAVNNSAWVTALTPDAFLGNNQASQQTSVIQPSKYWMYLPVIQ